MKKEQTTKQEIKPIVVLDRGVPVDELDGPTAYCCRLADMPFR
jgi:hypothetical protein